MHFLIVDDDFGSRVGMAQTLKEFYPGCEVHQANGLKDGLGKLDANRSICLILLDLNLGDSRGIATLKAVKDWCEAEDCNPRIVVVSAAADYDDSLIPLSIDHCATGFITKGVSLEVFRSALDLTLVGSIFIPAQYLTGKLKHGLDKAQVDGRVTFTSRERQVAALLIRGLTYKQIAKRLEEIEPGRAMSDQTVRVHVQRMAWKLRVSDEYSNANLSAKAAVLTAFAEQRLRFGDSS